jgi:hypothetical protein
VLRGKVESCVGAFSASVAALAVPTVRWISIVEQESRVFCLVRLLMQRIFC